MTNYDANKFGTEVEAIASNLVETLKRKNADYGNNVDKNIDEWGLSSLAIRLDDKLNRFKNLIKESNIRQVSDEAIEDTIMDLAGYAIIGYRKIKEINAKENTLAVLEHEKTALVQQESLIGITKREPVPKDTITFMFKE